MKKKICFFIVLVFLMNLSISNVYAKNFQPNKDGSVYLSAQDKTEFKKMKDAEYKKNNVEGKIKKTDIQKIESLILLSTSLYADKAEIYSELESYGCYVINPLDEELNTLSDITDMYLSTPTIYYNSYNSTWTVTCGGNWTTSR